MTVRAVSTCPLLVFSALFLTSALAPTASSYLLDVKVVASVNALNNIQQVVVSSDGTTAAAISDDGNLYIIKSGGASESVSIGEDLTATALAISADGDRILCGDSDGDVHLYDSSGNEMYDPYLTFLDDMIYSVDISSDGTRAVVSTDWRTIYFTIRQDGFWSEWSTYTYYECVVDLSADGQHLLVYDDETLNVFDSDGNLLWAEDWTPPGNGKIVWADLSEDGTKIGVLSDNRVLSLLSVRSGSEIWRVTNFGQVSQIYEGVVELSYDGSVIMAAHDLGPDLLSRIYIYHGDSPDVVANYSGGVSLAARISDDGKYLILQCYNSSGEDLRLIDLSDDEVVWNKNIEGYVISSSMLAISADGCFVAYGNSQYLFSYLSTIPRTSLVYSGGIVCDNYYYFSAEGQIQLTATFIGEGATTYWNIDDGEYREYNGPIPLSGYEDGPHTLSYYTVDSHGNSERTRVFPFIIDNTPPALAIISPEENVWVPPEFTVVWNATDTGCGLDHYSIEVDGEVVAENLQETTYHLRDLTDGRHIITLHAYDKLGNEMEKELQVRVDSTSPELTLQPDLAEIYINVENYAIQWSSADDLSGINHFEISVDGRRWVSISADQTRYVLMDLREGTHHVRVKAVDNAGNSIERSLTLLVDLHNPIVRTQAHFQYISPKSLPLPFGWEAEDKKISNMKTGVKKVVIQVKNIDTGNVLEVKEVVNRTMYYLTNLTEGRIEVTLTVYDLAGNNDSTSFSFVYDATPPEIEFSYWFERISNDVYVKVQGSDELSGISYYEIMVDEGEWREMDMRLEEDGKSIGEFTIYVMEPGDHKVYIRAVDRAGNVRVEGYTVHIGFVEAHVFELGVCLPALVAIILIIFLLVRRRLKSKSSPVEEVKEEMHQMFSGETTTFQQPSPEPAEKALPLEKKIEEIKRLRKRIYRGTQRLTEKGIDVSDVMGVLATASKAEKRSDFDLAYRATVQAWEMLKSRYEGQGVEELEE